LGVGDRAHEDLIQDFSICGNFGLVPTMEPRSRHAHASFPSGFASILNPDQRDDSLGLIDFSCSSVRLLSMEDTMELEAIRLNIPQGCNIILGQSHFIKSVEDLFVRDAEALGIYKALGVPDSDVATLKDPASTSSTRST
jgi:hypothetical protein